MAEAEDAPGGPLPALPRGSLRRPGGGLALASRCPGAGCGARSRAGGGLGCCIGVACATGAGFGRGSVCFGGGGCTGVGNVIGTDNGGVASTGSGTETTSGIGTGSGEASGCGGGVGSGIGVTATGIVVSGSGRSQDSRHACQPNDSTASPNNTKAQNTVMNRESLTRWRSSACGLRCR